MSYSGMDFVLHYEGMLDELDRTMHPEYRERIFRYRWDLDPHDLVSPDDHFENRAEMLQHLSILIMIDEMEKDPTNRN